MKKLALAAGSFLCITLYASAQSFLNGDLDGTISGYSSLPDFWSSVPYNDPVCSASNGAAATPDLVSLFAPAPENGLAGIPYTGATFVSGVHGASSSNFFHEGIMQEVSGLIPGNTYYITFHQSVDARYLCLDTSGSWSVHADAELIGITEPSISQVSWLSSMLEWEHREISFTATAGTHMIKFLPFDDDPVHQASGTDLNGALSMAIDAISISHIPVLGIAQRPGLAAARIYYDPDHEALFMGPDHDRRSYQLLDAHGRTIAAGTVSTRNIPLAGLVQGTYLLRWTTSTEVFRFVKY